MNRYVKTISTIMPLCILLSNTVGSFSMGVNNEEVIKLDDSFELIDVPIKDFGCSEKINKLLSEIEYCLNQYDIYSNLACLDKAMELFGEIAEVATEDDLKYFEKELTEGKWTVIYKYFYMIRVRIYELEDEDISSEYVVKFAKEILFGWRKNKIDTIYPDIYLVSGLVEYNENKIEKAQDDLNKLKKAYHYMIKVKEENTDSEDLPDIKDETDDSGPWIPEYEGEDGRPPNNSEEDEDVDIDFSEDNFTIGSYYEKRNNKCYIIETKYKDGLIISQDSTLVPKEDYVYCGIYENIFNNMQYGNSGGGYIYDIVIDEDYVYENQNEDSYTYVFYTVNKNNITPYYYNSGVRTDEKGSVCYSQLSDILYQISIKSEGFTVKSNEKSLFIIEGIPLVLDSKKDVYLKQEVEDLLKIFKTIGLRIEEEMEQSDNGLSEIVESEEYAIMKYNNKEYMLNNMSIKDSVFKASVQEVVGYFGYETSIRSNQIIISKSGYNLKLYVDKSTYVLNGEKGEFETPVTKNGSEYYADLGTLMNLIGYEIHWNPEDLYFEVDKL